MPSVTTVQIPGVGAVAMWLQAAQPARTLIHVATIASSSLGAGYNALPLAMWGHGWNVVSFDLPGHGTNLNPGETYDDIGSGLWNWARRADANENFVETCNKQVKLVTDWLVVNGKSKDGAIAISGPSRGGFVAIHALDSVDAIGAAVGLVPVADLAVLPTFSGYENRWVVKQTALGVSFKSTKPAYIEIGNADTAVNTADVARNVGDMINRMLTTNQIDFHISPGAFHAMPVGAESRAASWLANVWSALGLVGVGIVGLMIVGKGA